MTVTRPAEPPGEEVGEAIDAIRTAISNAQHNEDTRDELAGVFNDLRSKLGADLVALQELGVTDLGAVGVQELLPDVEALLLAALQGKAS